MRTPFRIRFPLHKQFDASDCGPACLKMVAHHYGQHISLQTLRAVCQLDREGVSIGGLKHACEELGFEAVAVRLEVSKKSSESDRLALAEVPRPFIAYWDDRHFVVVYRVSADRVWVADPDRGRVVMGWEQFQQHIYRDRDYGKVILLEPKAEFYADTNPYFANQRLENKVSFVKRHIRPSRRMFAILFFFLLFQLGLQSVSPFLTQYSFDEGILGKNSSVLLVVLAVQSGVFLLTSGFGFLQSVFSNRLSMEINFSLSDEFIRKVFKLPLSFYQQRQRSDFLNRISDLTRLESFLAHNLSNILLSIFGLLVLSAITLYYDSITLLIFLGYNALYALWVVYALRKRKELDYARYDISVHKHRQLIEMIEGVQEVKLNGNDEVKIQNLLDNQRRHFTNELRNIKVIQWLTMGGGLIKNLGYGLLVFYTGMLTINGQITIGEMAAIQLLIGQLNSMSTSVFGAATTLQEVRFSLERILEIHSIEDETWGEVAVPESAAIEFDHLTFSYSELSKPVLHNINLTIEFNKTTAIVGSSGSGKTTLMKLMLGLLSSANGAILLDGKPMDFYDMNSWRRKCGVVMQEGFIFTDTILENVTGSDPEVDFERYEESLKLAQLYDFVMSLPITHETRIGADGVSLSSGQKQRMLLARLIYKNPDYIFLDEATNSLDSETEQAILSAIDLHFAGRTRVVIAHRLNTVRHADKIIVIKDGLLLEQGTHEELVAQQGYYFSLVRDQLQLS